MTGNGDGLFPAGDKRSDAFYNDRSTENSSVQKGTDGTIGGFPHFRQVVFLHTVCVRGDGSAFYSNTIFFGSHCRVNRNLIFGGFTMFQSQIIILGVQIDVGGEQDILNHLPDDTGHLVAIHFNQGGRHLNLLKILHGKEPPLNHGQFEKR